MCIFSHTGAFCILPNSVTRNRIVSIVAFRDDYRNPIVFFDCQIVRFINCLNSMGWEFFGRPKIFSQKFLFWPARQMLSGMLWAPFYTLCKKSIQNGCRGNGQHFRYRRSMTKLLKKRKIALLVKEKGRTYARNSRQSCQNMHKGWFCLAVV